MLHLLAGGLKLVSWQSAVFKLYRATPNPAAKTPHFPKSSSRRCPSSPQSVPLSSSAGTLHHLSDIKDRYRKSLGKANTDYCPHYILFLFSPTSPSTPRILASPTFTRPPSSLLALNSTFDTHSEHYLPPPPSPTHQQSLLSCPWRSHHCTRSFASAAQHQTQSLVHQPIHPTAVTS